MQTRGNHHGCALLNGGASFSSFSASTGRRVYFPLLLRMKISLPKKNTPAGRCLFGRTALRPTPCVGDSFPSSSYTSLSLRIIGEDAAAFLERLVVGDIQSKHPLAEEDSSVWFPLLSCPLRLSLCPALPGWLPAWLTGPLGLWLPDVHQAGCTRVDLSLGSPARFASSVSRYFCLYLRRSKLEVLVSFFMYPNRSEEREEEEEDPPLHSVRVWINIVGI